MTDSELATFRDKGYLLKRGLFARDYVERLAREIDNLHDAMAANAPASVGVAWEKPKPGRPKRILQLMNSEKVSPILDAISRSDEVLSVMRQLIGPDVYLFHSKLLMKAAHDGTSIPWHQDWGYWRHACKEPTQINCMLAIDPATEVNGALHFVEGSQKRGPIDHKDLKANAFTIGLEGGLDAFESARCDMQPGDAVFFGCLVLHGSGANTSPHDRRANTFAYDKSDNMLPQHGPPPRRPLPLRPPPDPGGSGMTVG